MNNTKESHEDFMKRCMGNDFWEKSEAERFEMVLLRCLKTTPISNEQIKKNDYERTTTRKSKADRS